MTLPPHAAVEDPVGYQGLGEKGKQTRGQRKTKSRTKKGLQKSEAPPRKKGK